MKPVFVSFLVLAALLLLAAAPAPAPAAQSYDPAPPAQPVKLIFIHHSTGENWLTDGYGELGRSLDQNNYFVSDTNYGWGPDAIGDRTDIPDWVEWFSSGETEGYMQALVNESGQHAAYTRSLSDPGGENQVILFKSCFPNSALEGGPQDPPDPQGGLTVGHAKYVYEEILGYFANRPDKLFVVITAPPLSDPTYAANARAFNQWLLNDWLREYPLSNVAVFDFYTVLTGRNHHHRYLDGQIEHTFTPGADTLVYPSEDDHPSVEGSRKATDEFVPVLNVFYNRWRANAAPGPLPAYENPLPGAEQPPAVPRPPTRLDLIDDFEGNPPASTNGWQAYRDEATSTSITCAPAAGPASQGARSMQIDYNVAPDSWATCALFFDQPQDWSAAESLTFSVLSGSAGRTFDVDVYTGPEEARETYLFRVETLSVTAEVWVPFEVRWEQLLRAEWEENAGTPFDSSRPVAGLAFGFGAPAEAPNAGRLWVDDLHLSSRAHSGGPPGPNQPAPEAPAGGQPRPGLPFCGGAALLPLLLAGGWLARLLTRS